MSLQLRQICLVARELEPVIEDLTTILGINSCFIDPGVGAFGLENTLMPIGRNFLEVVAPIEENTAGGRYLDRRQGDGGYMVITQADTRETQSEIRTNALRNEVRIAHETVRDDWHLIQFHPGDLKAAFFEVETDSHNDFYGHWNPVGGLGWESKVKQDVTIDYKAVELQGPDPVGLAELWGNVAGLPVTRDGEILSMNLNNVQIRFVEANDGRGAGLSGLDIEVADRDYIIREANKRGCSIDGDVITICGIRWKLIDTV